MSTPPVVVQAFFNKKTVCHEPPFVWGHSDEYLGFKLWKPDGQAVFLWAIDCVVCTDERWCVFGPMSYEEGKAVLSKLNDIPESSGARIVNEHCFGALMKSLGFEKLPRHAWTDG